MKTTFNLGVAMEFGVAEAVIIENLRELSPENQLQISMPKLQEYIKYYSEAQIKKILQSIEDKKGLVRNKNLFNKLHNTNSYVLTEKTLKHYTD